MRNPSEARAPGHRPAQRVLAELARTAGTGRGALLLDGDVAARPPERDAQEVRLGGEEPAPGLGELRRARRGRIHRRQRGARLGQLIGHVAVHALLALDELEVDLLGLAERAAQPLRLVRGEVLRHLGDLIHEQGRDQERRQRDGEQDRHHLELQPDVPRRARLFGVGSHRGVR
jgi:hypothetical protein